MLTMTLETAPPSQTSEYKMVQLEHSTKLSHKTHNYSFFWGRVIAFGSYAPPDTQHRSEVDRDDIIQGYEVNKAALINSYKVNYLI
jgi:hypothetical protein